VKVLILAGGHGTRLAEETGIKPKPMVEVGGMPILWHIMKGYSQYGFNDFVVLLGYKGHIIKEYFSNYWLQSSSVEIDLAKNQIRPLDSEVEPWKVTLLDTGVHTMTGGRVKQAQKIVGNEPFLLTYGDGVSDVNIADLVDSHQASQKLLTMTAVKPKGRFGILKFDGQDELTSFEEKPTDHAWINGGFFVCSPEVFKFIENDSDSIFERAPLQRLANERQINTYKHEGFWKCMDTLADRNALNQIWESEQASWKTW
jgi:glucose-1-phosphate cytidylyltransferase